MRKNRPSEPYKITGREFQRNLFLASIREQIGQVADVHAKLLRLARSYVNEGLAEDEIRELMVIDGYDREIVDGCLSTLANSDGAYQHRWGFELEDGYGRIISHAEFGDDFHSEEEAKEEAEGLVAEGSANRVIRIFQLG